MPEPIDKTIRLNWEEWVEYCAEHNIDPHEYREDGHDLGGGNSLTIECVEDPPEEDEEIDVKAKKMIRDSRLGKEDE